MTWLRLTKLRRDMWAARARLAMMTLAIAVSLVAIGAVLTARAVLDREITRSYLATQPASATLDVPAGIDAASLAAVRAMPGVEDAAMRRSVLARMRVGNGRAEQILLFVVGADDPLRVGRFDIEQGRWPPADDAVLLERDSAKYFGLGRGDSLVVRTPNGVPARVEVGGTVHDPSLAPTSQETIAYGYLTPAGLARLGESGPLDKLEILVRGDAPAIERAAQRVGARLGARGVRVTRIEVPPPHRHPHQAQMDAVTSLFLAFGLLSLVLSAILVATMLGGLLAQQTRQVGVMKAIGATTSQLLGLYGLMALAIAVTATAAAIGPGIVAGRLLASVAAGLLNIDLAETGVPWWVFAVQALAGIGIPMVVASVPLLRSARTTVRDAIDDHGVNPPGAGNSRLDRALARLRGVDRSWAMAARNTVRRKGRLVLTLTLLAVAGALFVAGLDTASGWQQMVDTGLANKHYDLEVKLDRPTDATRVAAIAERVPGVAVAEAWASRPTTITGAGKIDVTRTYPDGGHNSFSVTALPPRTSLVQLPLLAGRWLRPDDTNAVVLTQLVEPQQAPGIGVGDDIGLTIDGRPTKWHVVGVVADFGTPATAYVTDTAFASATGTAGDANLVRVVTEHHDERSRRATLTAIEAALAAEGIGVRTAVPISQLETALDGHVMVLVVVLMALAVVMAIVGLLGLASTMSTNVTERRREIGVLRTLGATSADVRRIVVREGILLATLSSLLAVGLAVPLTSHLGDYIGNQAFHLPLPFLLSAPAVLLWALVAVLGGAAATAAAARRASRLTIRAALAYN